MSNSKFNLPTIFVIYGATGDLIKKKIVPALFYLYEQKALPEKLQVIGYSRRDWTDERFRAHITDILKTYNPEIASSLKLQDFLGLFSYHQGHFDNLDDYTRLAEVLGNIDGMWRVCSNKLFYLSVPPEFYQTIFQNLKDSHLTDPCSPEEGWTRVLVEKPFGYDLESARALDDLLVSLFREEQIYRIDHYLAKEILQNILAFRFANNLFERSWDNQSIERIDIRLLEKIGAEDRGAFYDSVGALRDVGQNHLLQMLALATMERPKDFSSDEIRAKRAELLADLAVLTTEQVKQQSFRAQYEGFRSIKGVAPDSQTETYFKLVTGLKSPRWMGVPVTLESGKRLGEPLKEIVVTFRHPHPCLCPPGDHHQNQVVFQLEPKEEIKISFLAKKPGLQMQMEERTFDFVLHKQQEKKQYVEEYAKLLIDAVQGDQTLFVSTAEVATMWRAVDSVIKSWEAGHVPLHTYKPDTKDITEEAVFTNTSEGDTSSKQLAIIGLGKMGGSLARQLTEKGWDVVGYNRSPEDTKALEHEGITGAYSLEELVNKLSSPQVVWLMLPAGDAIDTIIDELVSQLQPGDTIIDAGNSFYKDSVSRGEKLAKQGIKFIDVGFSGGPAGARNGGCLMVGGTRADFKRLEPLFRDASLPGGYQFFEGVGAGHFVKMIHNGIEYGMMQAIAEGFEILKASDYDLNLIDVAKIYNNGSVIESRLTNWLQKAFELHGEELTDVSGSVKHTGEGAWTIETAKEMGIETKIIEGALEFRVLSEKNPSFTGKVLSALREQFGGHSIK